MQRLLHALCVLTLIAFTAAGCSKKDDKNADQKGSQIDDTAVKAAVETDIAGAPAKTPAAAADETESGDTDPEAASADEGDEAEDEDGEGADDEEEYDDDDGDGEANADTAGGAE